MLYIVQTALQLGCIYSFVALALFLSYRILQIADLTTDGCFVLGMAVSIVFTIQGHPVLGVFMGMLLGGVAGLLTALLQTYFGVPSILAGIITNTGLYTVNLMVMGWSSNLSILKNKTIFTLSYFFAFNFELICSNCLRIFSLLVFSCATAFSRTSILAFIDSKLLIYSSNLTWNS